MCNFRLVLRRYTYYRTPFVDSVFSSHSNYLVGHKIIRGKYCGHTETTSNPWFQTSGRREKSPSQPQII